MKISFPVFQDKSGNRFIFKGLQSLSVPSSTERWKRGLAISTALGVKRQDDFEIESDQPFDKLEAEAGSPGFAHGSNRVWIIGGPLFDKALEKA